MKIGITGGRGVLGKIASKKFVERGHTVDTFSGDICDARALKRWSFESQMDAVLHFAAIVPTSEVNANPAHAFKVNIGGTVNLLEAVAALNQRPWILFSSSSHVYKSSKFPLKENSVLHPHNLYGETKRIAEDCLVKLGNQMGIPWCIARIFSFYHHSQAGDFLYPTLQRRFLEEDLSKPFLLKGMLDIRDISNAESIVEKLIKLTERRLQGTYNVGSGTGIKIGDFVRSISPRTLKFTADSKTKPTCFVADVSKLDLALNTTDSIAQVAPR